MNWNAVLCLKKYQLPHSALQNCLRKGRKVRWKQLILTWQRFPSIGQNVFLWREKRKWKLLVWSNVIFTNFYVLFPRNNSLNQVGGRADYLVIVFSPIICSRYEIDNGILSLMLFSSPRPAALFLYNSEWFPITPGGATSLPPPLTTSWMDQHLRDPIGNLKESLFCVMITSFGIGKDDLLLATNR